MHGKNAPRGGYERDLADRGAERGEELLAELGGRVYNVSLPRSMKHAGRL